MWKQYCERRQTGEHRTRNNLYSSSGRLTLGLALGVCLALPVWGNPIYYEATNLGGSGWRYDYTLGNNSATPVDWFTIFFDPALYDFNLIDTGFGLEVEPADYIGPADWDIFVAPTDPFLNLDGFYDAFALLNGVTTGEELNGFSINFIWLGNGNPGAQAFTLGGEDIPPEPVLFTQLRQDPPPQPVPAPGTMWLLGVTALLLARKRPRQLIKG